MAHPPGVQWSMKKRRGQASGCGPCFVFPSEPRYCWLGGSKDILRMSQSPKRQLDRLSRFCTDHRKLSLYFTIGRPFPSKLPLYKGDLDPHLTHASLGPPKSSTQTASRLFQPFLQCSVLTSVTDRQTDRQTTLLGL